MDNPPSKLVLVLGGSTFMGKTLMSRLRQSKEYRALFINRGRKYWYHPVSLRNGESKSLMNEDYYYGNREDHTDFTKLLRYINSKYSVTSESKWAAVIDFSAFNHTDVESVREAMVGLTELYVFISSDSIYDALGWKYADEPRSELEHYEVLDQRTKERAKEKEEYGYNKLKCELLLQKTRSEQFPYISLILPDVIGPYDDTGRYWGYLKWLERCRVDPIHMDEDSRTKRSSLVYSLDVVDLLLKLVDSTAFRQKKVVCKSYHLAFEEHPTLEELLNLMAESFERTPNYQFLKMASSFYPSVDFGCLNINRARQGLGWKPTPLKEAIAATTAFFLQSGPKYPSEDQYAERKLRKKLKP